MGRAAAALALVLPWDFHRCGVGGCLACNRSSSKVRPELMSHLDPVGGGGHRQQFTGRSRVRHQSPPRPRLPDESRAINRSGPSGAWVVEIPKARNRAPSGRSLLVRVLCQEHICELLRRALSESASFHKAITARRLLALSLSCLALGTWTWVSLCATFWKR